MDKNEYDLHFRTEIDKLVGDRLIGIHGMARVDTSTYDALMNSTIGGGIDPVGMSRQAALLVCIVEAIHFLNEVADTNDGVPLSIALSRHKPTRKLAMAMTMAALDT